MSHIAVVGAGLAGLTVAARLRAQGYAGRITLFGAEPAPPYDRPPLSKRYLLGEMRLDQLYLRAIEFYEQNNIVLRLDTAVEAIHPPSSTLIAGGKSESYSHLVLTTGSKPRRLS